MFKLVYLVNCDIWWGDGFGFFVDEFELIDKCLCKCVCGISVIGCVIVGCGYVWYMLFIVIYIEIDIGS